MANRSSITTQSQASSPPSSNSPSSSVDLPYSFSPKLPAKLKLEKLRRMLLWIEAFLDDAEERENHEQLPGLWLEDFRSVAYEVDDVLDEYKYEVLRAKAEDAMDSGEATVPVTHRAVRSAIIPDPSVLINDSFWSKADERIQQIQGKLKWISEIKDILHWREGYDPSRRSRSAMRMPTSPLVNETDILGREDDLRGVIGMLLSDACKGSDLFVIPIVGIGGVGKTSLAQLAYKNSEVRRLFQLRGWVSVSDDFDLVKLTRKILEVFTKTEQKLDELSVLQEMLMHIIKGKRFLLILDDVWIENSDLWNRLLLPLKHGKQGSAVIATTRSRAVATIMGPTHNHHLLHCLSTEDCWEVLKRSAFHGRETGENDIRLVGIGRQIAMKCKGLPLAAKSLGGVLNRDLDVESWKNVLESDIWEVDDKIIPALMLSYVHLPRHLKQCFLYASLFPKEAAFSKDELVRLWMAQGFLRDREHTEPEIVGNVYFDDLLKRSFFQNNPAGDPSLFVMHDLTHSLAQYISGGEHVTLDIGRTVSRRLPIQKARHLLLHGTHDSTSRCDLLLDAPEKMRTVLGLPPHWLLGEQVTTKMQSLRVLSLKGLPGFYCQPDAIGTLKHLRYLSLEHTQLQELPDSLGKLYHLQTLIFRGLTHLQRLPTSITNLPNLRCLEVGSDFVQMPRGIGRLTSLRSLDVFNVGEGEDGAGVEELKDLKHLRGSLTINNLEYVVDAEKAKEADLLGKENLRRLDLNWHFYGGEPKSLLVDQQKRLLENLRPHSGLTHLTISHYSGTMFPEWLANPSFLCGLAVVKIICPELISLPPFGQLFYLKHLEIRQCFAVEVVGSEFLGEETVGFPALEELVFEDMSSWTSWQVEKRGDIFPRLRRLVLEKCPQLNSMLPLHYLPALEELVLQHCEKLTSIELRSPSSPSPSSSTRPLPLPPLKVMAIQACPIAHFSPCEDEQLLLPLSLSYLFIDYDCPLLVGWFQTDAGIRALSAIPGAALWKDPSGRPFVSTDDHGAL